MSDAKSTSEPSMEDILASIRRIIAEDDRATVSAVGTMAAPADDEQILELTQAVNADGTVRHLADRGPRLSDAVEKSELPVAAGTATRNEPLVSSATSQTIASSFARLSELPEAPPSEPQPPLAGTQALDEAAREMLRPMLQNWLDTNLPAIVERLVAAEIARLAGGKSG